MKARCPTCEKPVDLHRKNPFRPFCSQRCRLIDLGAWLDESRRIPQVEELDISQREAHSERDVEHIDI